MSLWEQDREEDSRELRNQGYIRSLARASSVLLVEGPVICRPPIVAYKKEGFDVGTLSTNALLLVLANELQHRIQRLQLLKL